MNRLQFFNPTRRLVGRLFLWFWLTLIVTALLTAWIAQTFIVSARVETPEQFALTQIDSLVEIFKKSEDRVEHVRQALRRFGRDVRQPLIIVDIEAERLIYESGPPLHEKESKLVKMFIAQANPVVIKQGPFELIGPGKFTFKDKSYALFLHRPPRIPEGLLVWLIPCVVVISGVFCWLFAKSIVRPIRHLQSTGKRLANGELQARNDMKSFGYDEIGELAADFNRMAEQLQRLWQGQKRLLGDISHELRSPLARMQMAIGLAHQQDVEITTLDRIEREAVRMDALISQLLTLTRVETDKASLEPFILESVFSELFMDASFEASNVGKQFAYSVIPDVEVKVNKEQIQSAVENVLRNAIRYANSKVTADFKVDNTSWQLAIADDGPGLNQDECDAIFKPFYRPSTSRERQSGGAGLGLAIAQAAVDLHNGTIVAVPQESGGLQVIINVPFN